MAMQRRFAVQMGEVFPHGAYLVGEVEAVIDYDRSKAGPKVQAVDVNKAGEGTGLPVWSVPVLDADPEAGKRDKTVVVKLIAAHQPVPPRNDAGLPFVPVEFTGLSVTPYVDENGQRARLAWSIRAEGMTAPGAGATASKSTASKSAEAA
ncbi:MAG: plasmid replication, integration and excision activator [Dermatophilaceae bacterium]